MVSKTAVYKVSSRFCHAYTHIPIALEDNTDALLDLITKNDELLIPNAMTSVSSKRRHRTPQQLPPHRQATSPPQPTSLGALTNGGHRDGAGGLNSSFAEKSLTVEETELCTDFRAQGSVTQAPPTSTANLHPQPETQSSGDKGHVRSGQFDPLDATITDASQESTSKVQQPGSLTHSSQALDRLLELLHGYVHSYSLATTLYCN